MNIGIIGKGAIGRYVTATLRARGWGPAVLLTRGSDSGETKATDLPRVHTVADLPDDITLMVECAGHAALIEHGPAILSRGIDLVTVSVGALADLDLAAQLEQAARRGNAQLHLASGAIGGLDCLKAAKVGGLNEVVYVGRKPPQGWKGSPAEDALDLDTLQAATTHFEGVARAAAMSYPKNANVAAAVAIAGLGFDDTTVKLVADPTITKNIHEIHASGAFGKFSFQIEGNALPDNPRSSALAAMSIVSALERQLDPITT